jgi:hypothetical protein
MENSQTPRTWTYRASQQRADGGWRHIEATLPLDCTNEEMDQIIAAWKQFDGKAQAALKEAAANDQPPVASPDVVLPFGKHRGMTIRQVLASQRDYVEWLAQNAKEELVKRSARMALGEADEQAQAQQQPPDTDEHGEEIPF